MGDDDWKTSQSCSGKKWTGMAANENTGCGKNMESLFSEAGMAYSDIIERFAADHDDWAQTFLNGWEKMTTNGYSREHLGDGPQNSWLGFESWTKGEHSVQRRCIFLPQLGLLQTTLSSTS